MKKSGSTTSPDLCIVFGNSLPSKTIVSFDQFFMANNIFYRKDQ